MSAIEPGSPQEWRITAFKAMADVAGPEVDDVVAQRIKAEIDRRATEEVYADWYRSEQLPVHQQTWDAALGALAMHGHELCYRGTENKYYRHALSTGLLLVGEPMNIGDDVVATAMRVSATQETISSHGLRRVVAKAQRDSAPQHQQKAQETLHTTLLPGGMDVQTYTVATSRDRLSGLFSTTEVEVRYPRHAGYNDLGSSRSQRRMDAAMDNPDVWVRAKWLEVFKVPRHDSVRSEMHLSAPEMYMADTPDSQGRVPKTLVKRMADAADHLSRIATLGDMLHSVRGPLQEVEGFHPLQARNTAHL